MASHRFIIIDSSTGYIFGDTAVLPKSHVFQGGEFAGEKAGAVGMSPELACRWLDETIGEAGREYEECSASDLRSGVTGYEVYRADIGGSEAVTVANDGTDQEAIDAVREYCALVARFRIVGAD